MMISPLISIIIPVYNVAIYLDKCIKSVVNQTYKNLEIILVDDGSPDKCPAMCDEWAVKDSRISVIHQKNRGLSGARNAGTKIANGEYILYVDSDDWIDLCMVEKLYLAVRDTGSDVAICGVIRTDGKNEYKDDWFVTTQILKKEEAFFELICDRKIRSYAWNKLYKSEIIKQVEFPQGKIYEDVRMMHKVFQLCSQVVVVEDRLYYYYLRESSITGTPCFDNYIELLEAFKERYEYVADMAPVYKDIQLFRIAYELSLLLVLNQFTECERKKYHCEFQKIKSFLRKIKVLKLVLVNGNSKEKIYYFLAVCFPERGNIFYKKIRGFIKSVRGNEFN